MVMLDDSVEAMMSISPEEMGAYIEQLEELVRWAAEAANNCWDEPGDPFYTFDGNHGDNGSDAFRARVKLVMGKLP